MSDLESAQTALLGFGLLTVPSATRPDALGLLLMTTAGVAWAVYSLSGRTATDPIAANARSFPGRSISLW